MQSRLSRYKNRLIIGPGVWYLCHLLAEKAALDPDSKEKFDAAYVALDTLRENFICLECRKHMEEFCIKTKPEQFLKTSSGKHDSIGFARWVFDLHEGANQHAKKSSEKYEDVSFFFRSSDTFCSSSCEDHDLTIPKGDEPINPEDHTDHQAGPLPGIKRYIS
jgi:hypothetical protein